MLLPRDVHELWYRPTNRHIIKRRGPKEQLPIDVEEAELEAQYKQIRLFGSTWLKPPGITKTLRPLHDDSDADESGDGVNDEEESINEPNRQTEEDITVVPTLLADEALELDLDAGIPSADESVIFDDEEEEEDDDEFEEELVFEDGQLGPSTHWQDTQTISPAVTRNDLLAPERAVAANTQFIYNEDNDESMEMEES